MFLVVPGIPGKCGIVFSVTCRFQKRIVIPNPPSGRQHNFKSIKRSPAPRCRTEPDNKEHCGFLLISISREEFSSVFIPFPKLPGNTSNFTISLPLSVNLHGIP